MFIFTKYICSLASVKGGGREKPARGRIEAPLEWKPIAVVSSTFEFESDGLSRIKKKAIADTSVYVQYPYVYVYPIVYTRRKVSMYRVCSAVLNRKNLTVG